MTDRLSPQKRSAVMRAVRGVDTKPELIVRRLAHSLGYRFRLHRRDLPGRPDIVFPGRRKVVLVHGCWWHGHDCPRGARPPATNADYWRQKIRRNVARDITVIRQLNAAGWQVLVVWECECRVRERLAARLKAFLG